MSFEENHLEYRQEEREPTYTWTFDRCALSDESPDGLDFEAAAHDLWSFPITCMDSVSHHAQI